MATIELIYPVSGIPTYAIELPRPVLENSEQINSKRIVGRSRGLEGYVFRDPMWPQYPRLAYICEACSEQQKDDYLDFVKDTYGLLVKLIDYENEERVGLLLPGEITEQLRDCGYVISFDFEMAQNVGS